MNRGRIYRVVPATRSSRREPLGLRTAGSKALVGELSSANGWRRDTAQRLLVERVERTAVPLLEETLRAAGAPLARLHALWTLEGLEVLAARHVLGAVADEDPRVRRHAARLAERFVGGEGEEAAFLRRAVRGLARDPDARVRFQAALSVGYLGKREQLEPLLEIALRDSADPWTRVAVLGSLPGSPVALLEALVRHDSTASSTAASRSGRQAFIAEVAALVGRRRVREEIRAALNVLTADLAPASRDRRLGAVGALLEPLGSSGLARALEAVDPEHAELRSRLRRLFDELAALAASAEADLRERLHAVELLGHDGSERAVDLLGGFLDARYPPTLQAGAVRGLARMSSRRAGQMLVDSFPRQSPRLRREILDALLETEARKALLLQAVEDGGVQPREIDLDHRRELLESSSRKIRERAEELLAAVAVDRDRSAVLERYRQALAGGPGGGDRGRGEGLFVKHCSICHRLGDQGAAVGPDLAGMEKREGEALLVDILDPNRAVAPEYLNFVVVTRDGRVVDGLLAADTPAGIELRRAEGKTDFILRRDIRELRASNTSVMPEGLEQQLTPEQLADVIAFLKRGPLQAGRPLQAGASR